jgi:photosystem II stability/assembly factor-like uncharacterized protein
MPATAQDIPWEEYTIPIEGLRLSDLVFVDEDTGWGVGYIDLDPGARPPQYIPTIIHTTDGGKTWTKQETGIEGLGSLSSVCFIDGETGVTVGQEYGTGAPLILWTADGGATWSRAMVPGVLGALSDVAFTNDGAGWSVGADFGNFESLILQSTDGRTWTKQSHPTQEKARLSAIAFPTAMVGYAVGSIGWESPKPFMLKTADSGNTWTEVVPPLTEVSLNDAFFLDDQTGWVVGSSGDEGIVLQTTDGGASWEVTRVHGSSLYFKRVVFLDSLRGFGLVGIKRGENYYNAIYETLDGGFTWQQLYETTWYITCLEVYGNTLWAVENGTKAEPGATRTLKTLTDTALVHVNPPELTRIDVTPPEVTLNVNDQQQFHAKGYDAQGNEIPITPGWSAWGGTITTGGLYTAATAGDFTVTASVSGGTVTDTASVHVNPPALPMQTYEHPTLGTLCYPQDWNVITVDPDRFFVTDPTGKILAGYRLWDREMGPTARDFINNYLDLKPEGTKIGEIVPANLGGRPGLSTTFTYPWGSIEKIIVVILEDGTPVKLFIEGPPNLVTEYVSMGYYAQMADCCQFP